MQAQHLLSMKSKQNGNWGYLCTIVYTGVETVGEGVGEEENETPLAWKSVKEAKESTNEKEGMLF